MTPVHMMGYTWAGWLMYSQLCAVYGLGVWGPYL